MSDLETKLVNINGKEVQLIEPPTWNEFTQTKEYKELREAFNFLEGKSKEEISQILGDEDKFVSSKLDIVKKARNFENKLWEPYVENAKKIGIDYGKISHGEILHDGTIRSGLFQKTLQENFNSVIKEWGRESGDILREATKNGNKVAQDVIDIAFERYINSFALYYNNGDIYWTIDKNSVLKHDYHFNPEFNRTIKSKEARKALNEHIELRRNFNKKTDNISSVNDSLNKIFKENAKSLGKDKVYNHSLSAFGKQNWSLTKAEENLVNILADKEMALCVTSGWYHIDHIGISLKGTPILSYDKDIWTIQTEGGRGRRSQANTIEEVFDRTSSFDEHVITNLKPEKLWVKQKYFEENKDEVLKIAENANLDLDIIGGDPYTVDMSSTRKSYVVETIPIKKEGKEGHVAAYINRIKEQRESGKLNKRIIKEAEKLEYEEIVQRIFMDEVVYGNKNLSEEEIDKMAQEEWAKRQARKEEVKEELKKLKKELKNTEKKEILTSKEAFEKYGPNDERFYTSQGLNPKQQKEAINKLNSNRKSVQSETETIEQLQKEQEEIANNFYQSQKEANQIIDECHKLDEQLAEKSIKETKNIEQKAISETEEKLVTKEIGESAKKSLNTKKLGIGLAIAGGALLLGGLSHKKKQNKQEKENNKPRSYRQGYGSMSYNQDLAYANGITNFSTGHSTYSL